MTLEKYIRLAVGRENGLVSYSEIRKAQKEFNQRELSDDSRRLIDAVLSHFANGRVTEWIYDGGE